MEVREFTGLLLPLLVSGKLLPTEWLSICPVKGNGKDLLIYDTFNCESGYLFNPPLRDICICGHGAWQLKSDLCGNNILMDGIGAEGTCFYIEKPIRWIRYLGQLRRPTEEFNFLTDEHLGQIYPLTSKMSPNGYSYVVSINPRSPISDCSETTCYDGKRQADTILSSGPSPRILIGWLDKAKGMSIYETCAAHPGFIEAKYDWDVPKLGIIIDKMHYEQSVDCRTKCYPNLNDPSVLARSFNLGTNTTGVDTWENLKRPPRSQPVINETISNPTIINAKEPCEKFTQLEELPKKDLNGIRAQTLRLAGAYYSSTLLGRRAAMVNLTEYKYFKTARTIFERICPESEVPKALLKTLLLLFRVAVNESLEAIPFQHMGDQEEDERLTKSLESCLASVGSQKFTFNFNETMCPAKYQGVTVPRAKGAITIQSELRCSQAFNSSRFDYPIETAWKVVTFAHYFCAQHFSKEAFDHSRLEFKLRQLFNQQIVTRWYNPGRASKLLQHILQGYDLDKFKLGMDRCVLGAKYISPFQKWIKRPKYEFTPKKMRAVLDSKSMKQAENRELARTPDGSGYCLPSGINLYENPLINPASSNCKPPETSETYTCQKNNWTILDGHYCIQVIGGQNGRTYKFMVQFKTFLDELGEHETMCENKVGPYLVTPIKGSSLAHHYIIPGFGIGHVDISYYPIEFTVSHLPMNHKLPSEITQGVILAPALDHPLGYYTMVTVQNMEPIIVRKYASGDDGQYYLGRCTIPSFYTSELRCGVAVPAVFIFHRCPDRPYEQHKSPFPF